MAKVIKLKQILPEEVSVPTALRRLAKRFADGEFEGADTVCLAFFDGERVHVKGYGPKAADPYASVLFARASNLISATMFSPPYDEDE